MVKRLVSVFAGVMVVCSLSGCSMHDGHGGHMSKGKSGCPCTACADCHHGDNWDGGCKESCMKCKAMKEGKGCSGGCGGSCGSAATGGAEGHSCSGKAGNHAHPHPHK
jgi:hypothetical protein